MIIDASALLAMLQGETGGDVVESALATASISAINWSEVIQKLLRYDEGAISACHDLLLIGLKVIPFDVKQAELAAKLWLPHQHLGLSLADRACLQLGLQSGKTILTADKAWENIKNNEIKIKLIR